VTRRLLRRALRHVLPGAVSGPGVVPVGRFPVRPAGAPPFAAREQGTGPAILLVHGGSGTADSWTAVSGLLADRFRVLSFTRATYRPIEDGDPPVPGDGTFPGAQVPPAGSGARTMAAEVRDVLAVAAGLDEPALLVGHSSGAVVALEAALAAPSAFAGLLVYEPPLAVHEPLGGAALRRARAALDAGDPDTAMAVHLRDLVGIGAVPVAVLRRIPLVWRRMRVMAPAQIVDDEALEALPVGLERYEALDVPVLLLGGAKSPAHLRRRLDALAAALPRVDATVILAGQGHSAAMRAPASVAEVIAAFATRRLKRAPPPPPP
jgi:pimeloyl-ACP methyl ester carboxylesterase